MLDCIDKIIGCLLAPYFVVLILLLFSFGFYAKKKSLVVYLVFIFLVGWRSFFIMSSSRYCAIFLIVELLLACLLLKFKRINSKKTKKLLLLLVIVLFAFNIIDLFSSFRNIYIYDVKKTVSNSLVPQNTVVFLWEKDFNRFLDDNKRDRQLMLNHDMNNPSFFDTVHNQYDFWSNDALFVIREKTRSKDNPVESKDEYSVNSCETNEFKHQKIMQFYTNKKKNRVYSIYRHPKFLPPLYRFSEQESYADLKNLVHDGILKLCILEHDFYIFQRKNQLFWVIGSDLFNESWIVYHLYTNAPEFLPKNRIQYKFDNRSFQVKSFKEMEQYGRYKVFYKQIPKEYPVTKIIPGLNLTGSVIWFRAIRPTYFYQWN